MDCKDCPNKECYINSYCSDSWLEYVENFKIRKLFPAGQKIFSQGDLVTGIYLICSGKVKITMYDPSGQERIIRLAGDGKVLGHRGLSSIMTYPISAVTLTESELAYISNEEFFKLIRRNADLSFHMMLFFADELMRSEQKIKLNSSRSDNEKVAIALCLMIDAFRCSTVKSGNLDIPLSKQDFSNFAETSISSLSNVLDSLVSSKIISWQNNNFRILDEVTLRNLARMEN